MRDTARATGALLKIPSAARPLEPGQGYTMNYGGREMAFLFAQMPGQL
jgi:hypothetical protein